MRKLRADHVGQQRNAYEKNRKIVLASQSICGICGKPVDKTLKYPAPLSAVVDHIVPLNKGGHPSDINNLQLAHRWCNRQKADKLIVANYKKKFTTLDSDTPISERLPLHTDWKAFKAVLV